jgi:hypothetical protein
MNALVSCIVVPENLGCFASLLGECVIGALDLTGNLKIACLSFRLLEVHDNLAEICERCRGSYQCVITLARNVFQSCVRSQESFLGLYQKCTGASKKASLGDLTKLSYRQRLPK